MATPNNKWLLRVAKSVVVYPGMTQVIKVVWPILGIDEFEEINNLGLVYEFCSVEGVPDLVHAYLVGG